ncbi:gluconokinase [Altericista sp. CCNU0014]|uniref:gluconokinase n=1 Tax=Altericista sp. CCNU0014 TaxID=3082949 RepID=UPI00384CC0C0
MKDCPLVWIVMGVAGSGKTRIGRLLAEQLECDFLEGDRRHPLPNILKMQSQQPLNDTDRHQWLLEMEEDIRRAVTRNREIVVSCSALKASYRTQLRSPGRVQLVWLNVPKSELERRLKTRANHYMKAETIDSQIEAFEPIGTEENAIALDGLLPPVEIVDELLKQAIQLFPSLKKPWWQR